MKKINFPLIGLVIALGLSINVFGQKTIGPVSTYDAKIAKRVGADDYGMREYVFGILRASTVKKYDPKERDALQAGHMKNIQKLADEGKLVLAGPFMDDQQMRGIFIFNVKTVEEVKKLVEGDPLISGGYLELELHPWYGSAALMDVNTTHKKIQKKSF
jgi:uncharacterized protein YciI